MNYRNTLFKILEVGIQGQFRGTDSDGVGASLQLTILPGVKIGGAFTKTDWSQATEDLVLGLGGDAEYTAVGTRIGWRVLELGFVYSHQINGDLVQFPIGLVNVPVAFDADGAELYARVGLGPIGLIGGFTYLKPENVDPLLDADFETKYAIVGGEWMVARTAKLYTESRIDMDSVTATGASGDSVFTIGFRYDFSWRTSHK